MDSGDAARDFLRRIHENCAGILAEGRNAMVPVILDGENAWEYYYRNGRPFFRELYAGIEADPSMEAITVSEAFLKMRPEPLAGIFPGSWINANFDIWIGAEEDNDAWRLLLNARRAYDAAADSVTEEMRALALEEILIAEGSDWNWWYGPEHHSENREEFDQIYREHLANVYRALGVAAPPELSQPVLRNLTPETYTPPLRRIRPAMSGLADEPEWAGAGVYSGNQKDGAMHGRQTLVREVRYGSDGASVYLRVGFAGGAETLEGVEIQIHPEDGARQVAVVRLGKGSVTVTGQARAVLGDVLEIAVPVSEEMPGVRLSVWRDGLPVQMLPRERSFRDEREKV
jgi:alpha-amylase/alpha-mannosidase (GH57 family)